MWFWWKCGFCLLVELQQQRSAHRPLPMHLHYEVRHQQPFYLCLSRVGCSLGELQDVRLDKFCQAIIWNYLWQNLACIYNILNTAPHLLARTNTKNMSSIRFNLLTKQLGSLMPKEGYYYSDCLYRFAPLMRNLCRRRVWKER